MTAAGASLHMNSMASWSPSQSDPSPCRTCANANRRRHVAESAEIPPCPRLYDCGWGTLWSNSGGEPRFGQTNVARIRASGADDDHIVGVVDQLYRSLLLRSERDAQDRKMPAPTSTCTNCSDNRHSNFMPAECT